MFHAHPDVILEKSKRFAKGALEHYNKRKNVCSSFYSVLLNRTTHHLLRLGNLHVMTSLISCARQIKFELLDVMPVVMMPESGRLYTHVNFTAKLHCKVQQGGFQTSKEQLFFAELYNCGKRRASGGFLVTCCEPLGSDSTGEFFFLSFLFVEVQHIFFIN